MKGQADVPIDDERRRLTFPKFSLKRSWKDGAVGEEISRYAKDKSWLLGKVIGDLGGEPVPVGRGS